MLSSRERVDHSNAAVDPAVLEVLRHELVESIALGVGPEMRIEPRELVGAHAAECRANHIAVRIEHRELRQKLLGLSHRFVWRQERRCLSTFAERPNHGGDELDDRLVRDPNVVVFEPSPE